MKSFITTLAFCIGLSTAMAADELAKLKTAYQAAILKAVSPVNATYEKELQKLLEQYTKEGKLDAAAEVIAEIKLINSTSAQTASSSAAASTNSKQGGQASESTDHAANQRFFVKKTWKTPTGTLFAFDEKGTGSRSFGNDKTAFIWRQMPDGVVQVTGERNEGSRIDTWYLRFVSKTEAYYGSAPDEIGMKLTVQPR
ncbi:MAG: hypothetical protein J0L73_25325 [Verrucomicrobia bacterium]|nr:hypothetical protein [Verrucomicrobiota bacterium]